MADIPKAITGVHLWFRAQEKLQRIGAGIRTSARTEEEYSLRR
jgi:hypothetical protein